MPPCGQHLHRHPLATSLAGAIENFASHAYTNTSEEAACAALEGGQTDVCSGGVYQYYMLNATAAGLCNMSVVYRALANTFRLRMRLGLFDAGNESAVASQPYWNVPLSAVNTTASQALSLSAAKGSMVLLKHDGVTLPLPVGRSIAIVGPHSNAMYALLGNYIGQICPSNSGEAVARCMSICMCRLTGKRCTLPFNFRPLFAARPQVCRRTSTV